MSPVHTQAEAQQYLIDQLGKEESEEVLKTLQARQQLAAIQVQNGKGHEMEQTYIDLVNDYSRVMGPEHHYTLRAMLGLANVYTKLAQWEDCEHHARNVHERFLTLYGPHHFNVNNSANVLAVAKIRLGKLDEAQSLLEPMLAQLANQQDNVAQIYAAIFRMNLTHLRLAQQRIDDARQLHTTLQQNIPDMLKADADFIGELHYLNGLITLAEGDSHAAQPHLQTALDSLRKRNHDGYWIIQDILRLQPDG